MVELIRTNDTVLLSWLQAFLRDAGIDSVVLDLHASVMDGSVGAVPRRVMIDNADETRARALLREAGVLNNEPERQPV